MSYFGELKILINEVLGRAILNEDVSFWWNIVDFFFAICHKEAWFLHEFFPYVEMKLG